MDDGIKVKSTDGALTKGLKISLNNTALKLKGGWKQSVFARCFPSLATHHEASLDAIRNSALEPSTKALLCDLSAIVEEELEEPMNRLSALSKNNTKSQDYIAWRPIGSPEQDIRPHDAKVLHCQKQILEELLDTHRKKRIQLFNRVKNGRMKCDSNNININNVVQSLQDIQAVCDCVSTKRKRLAYEETITSDCVSNKRRKQMQE